MKKALLKAKKMSDGGNIVRESEGVRVREREIEGAGSQVRWLCNYVFGESTFQRSGAQWK